MSYTYSTNSANKSDENRNLSTLQRCKSKKMSLFLDYNLYGMTAEKFSKGRTNLEVVKIMLESGIKIIQYREKQKSLREKYYEAIKLRKMTQDYDALLIINDHIDLCKIINADGVHLGQDDIPPNEARKILNDEFIIGVTVHTPEQFIKAFEDGADYVGLGPIYQSFTKEKPRPPIGLEVINWASQQNMPFVAIGGIKENNILEVLQKGAKCICAVTEITESENIKQKIKNLFDIMEEFKLNSRSEGSWNGK